MDAIIQLKLNYCLCASHLYIHFFSPKTSSINQMRNDPTNPFVINKRIILCMHRAYIQDRLSMLERQWVCILGRILEP